MEPPSSFSKLGTVKDLDAEILRTKLYLRALYIERNLRAPVSRLPDEILVRICQLYAQRSTGWVDRPWEFDELLNPGSIVCFLSVCHRWYSVILNNATMWGSTISERDVKQVPVLLQRSKQVPLSVNWRPYCPASQRDSTLEGQLGDTLTVVLRQFSRIRWLNFTAKEVYRKLLTDALVPSSSSLLEVLSMTINFEGARHQTLYQLQLVQGDNLRSLRLEGPVVPQFTVCKFPQLENLSLFFNTEEEPPLGPLLIFLSNSSRLQTIELNSRGNGPIHQHSCDYHHIVDLPRLRSLRCGVQTRASPLLSITRHIKFSPQTMTDITAGKILDQPHLEADANANFGYLWPLSAGETQPKDLSLIDDNYEFVLGLDEGPDVNFSRGFSRAWRFFSDDDNADHPSAIALERLHFALVALKRSAFCLEGIELLECTLEILPSTWLALFSSCRLLTDVRLRLNAAIGFLALFTPKPSTVKKVVLGDLPLPALAKLSIEEGGRWWDGSWSGVLSGLAIALELRASRGYVLQSFTLDRYSEGCRDANHYYHISAGWDAEETFLERIRELVPKIEVFGPPDKDEIYDSCTESDASDGSMW